MRHPKVQPGQRFHLLTVIEEAPPYMRGNRAHERMFRCLCDCGKETTVLVSRLRSSRTKSCGCLRAKTHIRKAQSTREARRLWEILEGRLQEVYPPDQAEQALPIARLVHVCYTTLATAEYQSKAAR